MAKAIEPKAKAVIRQAHNTFHDDLETIVKEGGNNQFITFLHKQLISKQILEKFNIGKFFN